MHRKKELNLSIIYHKNFINLQKNIPPKNEKEECITKHPDSVIFTRNEFCDFDAVSSHKNLLDLINQSQRPIFNEYISGEIPVPPFFDIELTKKELQKDESLKEVGYKVIKSIVDVTKENLQPFEQLCYILQSHKYDEKGELTKYSVHLKIKLVYEDVTYLFSDSITLRNYILKTYISRDL